MKTTTVRFDETPVTLRTAEAQKEFAAVLRACPGQVARFGNYRTPNMARQTAYAINKALRGPNSPFAPAGSFEATARTVFNENRVYVRFVGGESE